MIYLARRSGNRTQTVREHLLETATLAERSAAKIGLGRLGWVLGMAHDLGKYSDQFQARLDGGERCDHSTFGAQLLHDAGVRKALAMIAAGHHGGLMDVC